MCENSSSLWRASGAEGTASSGGENAGLCECSEETSLCLSGVSNCECVSFSDEVSVFSPLCFLRHRQQTTMRMMRMMMRRREMIDTRMYMSVVFESLSFA